MNKLIDLPLKKLMIAPKSWLADEKIIFFLNKQTEMKLLLR